MCMTKNSGRKKRWLPGNAQYKSIMSVIHTTDSLLVFFFLSSFFFFFFFLSVVECIFFVLDWLWRVRSTNGLATFFFVIYTWSIFSPILALPLVCFIFLYLHENVSFFKAAIKFCIPPTFILYCLWFLSFSEIKTNANLFWIYVL